MTYESRLKAWSVEKAIEIVKATDVAGILNVAATLYDHVYEPEEDFEETAKRLSELIQKSVDDPLAKIKFLQDELAFAEEQIGHQIALAEKQKAKTQATEH